MKKLETSISVQDNLSAAFKSMNTVTNNAIKNFERLNNTMSSSSGADYWTSAIGNYNKQALEAVYTTQELVDMGFKSADALKAQEVAAEQIKDPIEENADEQKKFNHEIKNGNSVASELGTKIKQIVKAYLGIQGIRKVVGFIQDTTDAADLQLQAEQKLNTITQKRMSATKEQVNALKSQASALQQIGVIGDEITITGQATLSTFLNSTKAVESLTPAMDNLLAYTNGVEVSADNAMSIANQIGKAMANNSLSTLTRSGITVTDSEQKQFKALTSEEEKAALLAKIITNNVGEMNRALLNTPAGQQQQIANAWGDLQENIGFKLYPSIMKFFSTINKNMPIIKKVVNGFANSLSGIINILSNIVDGVFAIAEFIANNWSIIKPVVLGIVTALGLYYGAQLLANTISVISTGIHVAMAAAQMMHAAATGRLTTATAAEIAAQNGLNVALNACPLVWILALIILVIAAIYAIIAAINKFTGSTISATGAIVGTLTAAVAFIWNLFLGLLDLVLSVINAMVNPWISFANFFANLFNDPVASIIHLFGDMADNILGVIESIAKAIDKVFGSNLASSVQGWRNNLNNMVKTAADKYGNGSYEKIMNELNLSSESLGFKRWNYADAYNSGYTWGANLENSIGDMFNLDSFQLNDMADNLNSFQLDDMADNLAATASNTGVIADSLDATGEELKYLRDLAEQEVVNRYTTAQININMKNNNNISKINDLDGFFSDFGDKLYETSLAVAEGVHK